MIHTGYLKTYINPGSWNNKAWTMCPKKARPVGQTLRRKVRAIGNSLRQAI